MGVYLALRDLKEWGLIADYPQVVAVQAQRCAPLAMAAFQGSNEIATMEAKPTVAEGIAIAHPPRGRRLLQVMRELNGRFVTVSEDEILSAHAALALRGVAVEYTSAVNYAAYVKLVGNGGLSPEQTVVLPFCGAGLKSSLNVE